MFLFVHEALKMQYAKQSKQEIYRLILIMEAITVTISN